ncbi:von Willebrand factor type A domain protein [Necator americanus]|uniref:von Willebrand factor type A domain protein n=2 Tax=Strongyloidea TaxID=27829 RepID=W2TJ41_NECAM|nr:von Willebrand factor type A domain protein [Necator americanus]ETN81788.1 von Willebrand factor type A domain protein [Necator americanus]
MRSTTILFIAVFLYSDAFNKNREVDEAIPLFSIHVARYSNFYRFGEKFASEKSLRTLYSIEECARVLSENLQDTFKRVTKSDQIIQLYDQFVEPEQFDPREELKRSKTAVENYLRRRAEFAYKAKVSLEVREVVNASDEDVNDPNSKDFIRFMSAKQGNDATTIYVHDHSLRKTKVNETRSVEEELSKMTENFTLAANANFYSLPTSSIASAVHIPTPLYDRNPELLRKIEWSQIDEVYRTHREETRDLAFQLFCSESGYMRFFPAASWFWDNHIEHLDLFDCRNTQWYINAATNSKNVVIMLDMSGSMLGQRYEIAKQTTEAILETLSHNDYFNIMPFSKNPSFLDDCNGKNGLLQATMRNKKVSLMISESGRDLILCTLQNLRNKMNNVTSEGKAEYEKALPHAFTALLNLPGRYELHTREEMALMAPNSTKDRIHVVLPEYVLSADPEYIEAPHRSYKKQLTPAMLFHPASGQEIVFQISAHNGRPDQGCENVIMLITDGAPNNYKEIFDLYNKDKKVRFFSFLIGEEAIDFEQVKNMACNNRGYMVHVQNMADVEDKVQHYIRTMSRPIGQHAGDLQVGDAMWSGVYRERLYLPRPETFAEPVPITNQSYAVMNKMAARRVSPQLWSSLLPLFLLSLSLHVFTPYLPRPETFAEPVPITNQSKIRLQKTEARGRMFVTTVSFPVIVNRTFMGVAAVNIPLTELNQQAHPSNIGGRSYFFMLDQNGFIMFHPQLRPIVCYCHFYFIRKILFRKDPFTKSHKQNYNNMDLLELEVPQSQQIRLSQDTEDVADIYCDSGTTFAECVGQIRDFVRRMVMDCDNSDPQQLDILYATEMLDRVYPQTNSYYSECIKGANFVLGLAVAKGDDHRWRPKTRTYDYHRVQSSWTSDKQWKVHPHWRYCLLNDTDTNITKEEAFMIYASQMRHSGKILRSLVCEEYPKVRDYSGRLPDLCRPRENLVRRLLVDLEATSALQDSWDLQWQFLKDNLIHLVFFATPSGLIRYYNQTLGDYDYEDPNWSIFDHIGAILSIEHVQELFVSKRKTRKRLQNTTTVEKHIRQSYNHFITDLYRKSVDDPYYRRSVRMKDHIVFDVSNKSHLFPAKIWYKSETQLTGYGLNENLTMLAQGTKAIYLGNALLGVAGFEFAYDYVVNLMGEHGCEPSDDRRWCVLLDEHGYVFYSNQKDISYEDYLQDPYTKGKHISQWFGGINRVSQRAMALLVEKRFYTKLKYTDHQAMCKERKMVVMSATSLRCHPGALLSFFHRKILVYSIFFLKPFRWIYRWLMSSIYKLILITRQYPLLHFVHYFTQPVRSYTASFHEGSEGYPCSKHSYFYLSNRDGRSRPQTTTLVDMNRSDRPCTLNSAKCSVKMQAAFVEGTNLVMVWIIQDKTSDNCYDETQCPKAEPSEVPFGFEQVPPLDPSEKCTGIPHRKPARSQSMCYNVVHETGKFPCSFSPSLNAPTLLFVVSVALRVFGVSDFIC